MGHAYTFKDLKQSLLGSFDMVLFYFVLRSGEPMPFLDARLGAMIAAIWGYVLYQSFEKHNGEHFFINYLVTFGLCVIMTVIFKIATWEAIKANPLGSPAMVFTWLGLPIALIFDKENISNILKRYYIRG